MEKKDLVETSCSQAKDVFSPDIYINKITLSSSVVFVL